MNRSDIRAYCHQVTPTTFVGKVVLHIYCIADKRPRRFRNFNIRSELVSNMTNICQCPFESLIYYFHLSFHFVQILELSVVRRTAREISWMRCYPYKLIQALAKSSVTSFWMLPSSFPHIQLWLSFGGNSPLAESLVKQYSIFVNESVMLTRISSSLEYTFMIHSTYESSQESNDWTIPSALCGTLQFYVIIYERNSREML